MTVEVCVKAAVGAPDTLGDCECSRSMLLISSDSHPCPPPISAPDSTQNPIGFSDPSLELAGRSLLPEGAAHAGGEEGPLRDEARRPQQQARMVRPISLSRLFSKTKCSTLSDD